MPTILCRIVWAKTYKLKGEKFYAGNMRYPKQEKDAHELRNFYDENGKVYGFVENSGKSINLEKLGGSVANTSMRGVTVIWCALAEDTADLRVVGWYNNAIAHSHPKTLSSGRSGERKYQFETAAKDAHLLLPQDRQLKVPMRSRRTDKGYIGQTNWFFPESSDRYTRFMESFWYNKAELGESENADEGESRKQYLEAQAQVSEVRYFARNGRLAADAKKKYGYQCEVCRVDFREKYGPLGMRAIEVHHLRPLKFAAGARETTIDDVKVLCANCHRMIHDISPPFEISELRKLLGY